MTEVSTRTTVLPIPITCPTWCVTDPAEHAADVLRGDVPLHQGPKVGRFEMWLSDGRATVTLTAGISNDTDLTADDLRELAGEALAAVEWMEANA